MTRWEFITSDEYLKATADLSVRVGVSFKDLRKEIYEFMHKYRDELLHGEQPKGGCGNEDCKVCYPYEHLKPIKQ